MPLLNPCPICGKQPATQYVEEYRAQYKLFCGVHVSVGEWFPNTEAAEKDWNRRTTDPMQPDLYKPTHADRIRAMSDEELAKIIASDYIGERLHFCQEKLECNTLLESEDGIPEEKCEQCATDWLKQPAEEEETMHEELIQALRCNMVETGSLVCLGCGREHSCSTRGCAILREAADAIEAQAAQLSERDAEIARLNARAAEDIMIAVSDYRDIGHCVVCKSAEERADDETAPCWNCTRGKNSFEWRGRTAEKQEEEQGHG